MIDFSITEHTQYEINCESCDKTTELFTDEEEVTRIAKSLGFSAYDSPEDGTMNFCKDCTAHIIDTNDFPPINNSLTTNHI